MIKLLVNSRLVVCESDGHASNLDNIPSFACRDTEATEEEPE